MVDGARWEFRGAEIVRAIFETEVSSSTVNFTLIGSSAGAIGAGAHASATELPIRHPTATWNLVLDSVPPAPLEAALESEGLRRIATAWGVDPDSAMQQRSGVLDITFEAQRWWGSSMAVAQAVVQNGAGTLRMPCAFSAGCLLEHLESRGGPGGGRSGRWWSCHSKTCSSWPRAAWRSR